MTPNSNSDMLFGSDDSKRLANPWSEMVAVAGKCPGLAVLDRWVEESLVDLEKSYASFATNGSIRRDLRRDRK